MHLPHSSQQAVFDLVISVGKFQLAEFVRFDRGSIEEKGLNDLVSYVDRESEIRLREGLQDILPGSGMIGEEYGAETGNGKYDWIIDPLDGTTNFTQGLPVFCVSVGLKYEDRIVFGVIYDPNRDELFHAIQDGGAYINGKPIRVASKPELRASVLATGFPYTVFDRMPAYMAALGDMMVSSRGVRRMGAAAIDLAWVACGRYDYFFEAGLNVWDVAAGGLLVLEAGGVVSGFLPGQDWLFGRFIAAGNPIIHGQAAEILRKRFA